MEFPRRGEIYFIDFPVTGAGEMAGPHPALILQNDVGNRASQLTIVAAITSNPHVARLPVVHLGHLYTIDKRRLGRRIGVLSQARLRNVDRAIQVSLGLRPFDL